MDTLHGVAHDEEQARPVALSKLCEGDHYAQVNALLVGLPQTHDENSVMVLTAVF